MEDGDVKDVQPKDGASPSSPRGPGSTSPASAADERVGELTDRSRAISGGSGMDTRSSSPERYLRNVAETVGSVAVQTANVAFEAGLHAKTHVKKAVKEELKGERVKSFLANPRVFWRHPLARMAVTWIILAEDFFIYAEDPVNDSHVRANFPGMGHIIGLVTLHTCESVGLAFLKIFLIIASIILGTIVGRQFLVRLMRNRWKVTAFFGCEGAIVTVSIFILAFMFLSSLFYNVCIPSSAEPISGASLHLLVAFGSESLQYRHINQGFQCLSGSVDLLAILMVADQVFQDKTWYPNFVPTFKKFWSGWHGRVRVIAFWVMLLTSVTIVCVLVKQTGPDTDDGEILWDDETVGGTDEDSRSVLAAAIVLTDLLTVMQDWSFPLFRDSLEVEVPLVAGTMVDRLQCDCFVHLVNKLPKLPARLAALLPPADWLSISISGKWMTYGPLLGVMVIDLFCTKTQIMYEPNQYGQYVDPSDNHVVTITDEAYLAQAFSEDGVLKRPEMISWAARWNTTTGLPISASTLTDYKLNSRYDDSDVKYIGLLFGLIFIFMFGTVMKVVNWRLRKGLDLDEHAMDRDPTINAEKESGADTAANHIAVTGQSAATRLPAQEGVQDRMGSVQAVSSVLKL